MSTTATALFSSHELAGLNKTRIPRHVAIIPDGNRRWAKKETVSTNEGHAAGASNIIQIVKAAKEIGIKAITFYLFSTENWTRPQEEIDALMILLQVFLITNCQEMMDEGVRLHTIGDLKALSKDALDVVEDTKKKTTHCNHIDLVLALNYGARDEIRRAFHSILNDYTDGKLHKEEVTENLISSYLDTNPWEDPDLFIRTSGEMRVSNFLLWQLSYAEFYISDVLWPDFKPSNLLEAVADFQKRERRWGGA